MALKRTLILITLLTPLFVPMELTAQVDNNEVVLNLRDMDTNVEVIEEKLADELPEEAFLYRPRDDDDTAIIWIYELELPMETVRRRIKLDPDGNRATSGYWFDAGDERTCRRVLNMVLRRDGADTVAREKGMFDVCENVRSVGQDDLRLRWNNEQLQKEFTVDIERDKRSIHLQYSMPFLGH